MKTVRNYNGEEVGSSVHKFQLAGLGKAPFRFDGQEVILHQVPGLPPRAGSSCDFCGMSIANVFWIKSSDGRRFKVGWDCAAKTGDAGLCRVIDKKVAEAKVKATHARQDALILKGKEVLANANIRGMLALEPHPYSFRAERGDSLLDFAEYAMRNSGRRGCCEVSKDLLVLASVVGV